MAIHIDDRPIYIAALAPRSKEPEFDPTSPESPTGLVCPHDGLDQAGDRADVDFGCKLASWWAKMPAQRLQVFASTRPTALKCAKALEQSAKERVNVSHTSALNPLLLPDHDGAAKAAQQASQPGGAERPLTDRERVARSFQSPQCRPDPQRQPESWAEARRERPRVDLQHARRRSRVDLPQARRF
jgi:hypothetical protein